MRRRKKKALYKKRKNVLLKLDPLKKMKNYRQGLE
jgi:hypothetical protein